MAALGDIHGAIAGRLSTIDGLRAFPNPPQGATAPVAYVRLTEWAIDTFSRTPPVQLGLEVVVLTAQTVRPEDGYAPLMEFADPTGSRSIRLAVWDGNEAGTFSGTWNGTAFACLRTQAVVTGFRVLGVAEMDEFQMYGGAFAVTVTTSS